MVTSRDAYTSKKFSVKGINGLWTVMEPAINHRTEISRRSLASRVTSYGNYWNPVMPKHLYPDQVMGQLRNYTIVMMMAMEQALIMTVFGGISRRTMRTIQSKHGEVTYRARDRFALWDPGG